MISESSEATIQQGPPNPRLGLNLKTERQRIHIGHLITSPICQMIENYKSHWMTEELEALRDLTRRFVAVVGPDKAGAAKPDPHHLLFAIQAAGGSADRALMVGDSSNDVAAGVGR